MDRVIIFGAGNNYEIRKENYKVQFEILGVVDNNYKQFGENIKSPEVILEKEFDKVIITPTKYDEIYTQLLEMGVPVSKIIIDILDNDSFRQNILGNGFWGQHADDLIIEAIFARLEIKKPSYIDLGCNHPTSYSNTIAFYKAGCRGINVDASPDIIDMVKVVKPDDINLNVGVAAKEGELTFYMVDKYSGRNTFCLDEIKSWGGTVSKTIQVPVITLQQIIDEYCPNGFPDFLDCDIEGLDYEVLDSYDLKSNGPKVICVEVRGNEIAKFDNLLDSKDYYRFCRIGENNIYVQKKYSGVVSHISF